MDTRHFWEIETSHIQDKCILLDVDGTIAIASSAHMHPGVQDTVRLLKKNNEVVLFSNNTFDHTRNIALARDLSIPYAATWWRKPMPFVLRAAPNPRGLPMVIVGDLLLTDGLLAFFTRSQFIRVKRYTAMHESRRMWLALYWIDDLLAKLMMPTLFPVHKV